MELFSRALHLRWLWFWTDTEQPWVGTETPCYGVDKQLFRLVGNGVQAKFWESSWLNGHAPRDIAPSLYKAWVEEKSIRSRGVDQSQLDERIMANDNGNGRTC